MRAARTVRRRLAAEGLDGAFVVPPPPDLPAEAERGMRAALRRRGETCLVRAIVRQAWEVEHGRRRDLVIGVTGAADFHAHAWLEGDRVPAPGADDLDPAQLGLDSTNARGDASAASDPGAFHELMRRPAPAAPQAAR